MNRLVALALLIACVAPAAAADQTPTPPPVARVELSGADVRIIESALALAASACATVPDGCVIGYNRPRIAATLDAALEASVKGK